MREKVADGRTNEDSDLERGWPEASITKKIRESLQNARNSRCRRVHGLFDSGQDWSSRLDSQCPVILLHWYPESELCCLVNADIICIQETKLSKKDMEELHSFALADGW